MAKLLTNEELDAVAKELDVDVTYVKNLYEQALKRGNPFMQQTKEVELQEVHKASAPALGGAATKAVSTATIVPATTEADEAFNLGPMAGLKVKAESLELYEALMELTPDDYAEFEVVAEVVRLKRADDDLEEIDKEDVEELVDAEARLKEKMKKDKKEMPMKGEDEASTADEEEDTEEEDMKMKKKAETNDELVALKQLVTKQAEQIDLLAQGMNLLLEKGKEQETDVPRNQAEQSTTPPATTASDEEIMAQLKQAEQASKTGKNQPFSKFYSQFTSKRLNQ